jgi:hypothetical protein
MKRISLSILFVLFALLGVGCGPMLEGSGNVTTETRQVRNFDQVELQGIGELYVTQGDEESLRIEAEDNLIPYITTEVHGKTLEIGFETMVSVWPHRPVKYYLTLKDVSALRLSGSGNIRAERLAADQLELGVSGSGNLIVNELAAKTLTNSVSGSGDLRVDTLKADSVKTTISGSGTCDLSGETDEQSARVSGSGDYLASDLQSGSASVHIAGSGNAQTWVTENLNINVAGSGDVEYYGTPSVNQQVAGSGHVTGLGSH